MAKLVGKQSVRATFKLSEDCINAISIVAAHLGIKQKSLFDHLLEDPQLLDAVARELRDMQYSRRNPVQKTFVLSRNSLVLLERTAKSHNTPRDALIEFSVQRLLPLIAEERKKHVRRKAHIADIERHFSEGVQILERLSEKVGRQDYLTGKMASVMANYESALQEIRALLEKGKLIEAFQESWGRRSGTAAEK
jgi:hypothetical protein